MPSRARRAAAPNSNSSNPRGPQQPPLTGSVQMFEEFGYDPDDMQTQILKVVTEVAKAQNIEIVVDKQALLYGGRDITSLVVQKLPKN